MEETSSIFDGLQNETWLTRRQLMPGWMKICCWIFMFLGVVSIICLAIGLFGYSTNLSLYGLESNVPLSLIGLFIIALFIIKGLTAFALWFEKDFAVLLGKIDAITGIAVCIAIMLLPLFLPDVRFKFRFELVVLAIYLRRLLKMQKFWDRNAAQNSNIFI